MMFHILLVSLLALLHVSAANDDLLRSGPSSLTYYFFSKANPQNSITITSGNTQALRSTSFNVNIDTVFLIHGWRADNESDFNSNTRDAILAMKDANIFVIDWGIQASGTYSASKSSVVQVGTHVADFIRELQNNFGLLLRNVQFVGWSLGAHIAGCAGAELGGQVRLITGLDPAGHMYSVNQNDDRLDETDAQFVQVIHTSSTFMGIGHPSGHADYYPNGGSGQPGCNLDLLGGCSHSRVCTLYAESILNNGFTSTQCDSWNNFRSGVCNNNVKSFLGGLEPDYSARGLYFLTTNSRSPFSVS